MKNSIRAKSAPNVMDGMYEEILLENFTVMNRCQYIPSNKADIFNNQISRKSSINDVE